MGVFGRKGSSGASSAVLEEPAPLFFFFKNSSFGETFGKAPLNEPELEPGRSFAKQALIWRKLINWLAKVQLSIPYSCVIKL